MKKLLIVAMAMLASIAQAVNLNNRQVSEASLQNIDAMLSYGLQHQGSTEQSGAELNAHLYSKLGVDIPSSISEQAKLGKAINKVKKLQKGDLVFFRTAESKDISICAVVFKMNENNFDVLYVDQATNTVKLGNSEYGEFRNNFVHGVNVTTDKDLEKARANYSKLVKASQKADENVTKCKEKLEKAKSNVSKAEDKVKDAKQKAEAAENKAKNAEEEASRLQEESDNFEREIQSANANAQEALSNNNAKSYEKQSGKAAKLLEKKDKAKEKATKAQGKAVSAKADASKANDKVGSAKSALDKAKSEVSKAENELEKAEKQAAELKAQLEK